MPAPLIEAHRGDSATAPENTLAACRRAVALGALSLELDVHPAQDGTLVVMHDDTVDRTTNGRGAVASLSVAALRALDAGRKFGPAFAGEPVPLLSEVLALLAPTCTMLNIEIKASPPSQNVPAAVLALLRQYQRERDYVVSSFDLAALLAVRALTSEVALALIGDGPRILPLARQHRLPWIHAAWKTVDAPLVAEAHAAGIRVNVWTVDEAATLPHWQAVGVDKLCTNRPADFLAAARR